MNNFGRVGWQGCTQVAVFGLDQGKDLFKLGQSLNAGRHQGIAAINRWNFGDPARGLIAVKNYFVVVQSHIANGNAKRSFSVLQPTSGLPAARSHSQSR